MRSDGAGTGRLTVRSGAVKRARRLSTRHFRAQSGEFLAEGPQCVREALSVPGVVLEVFATADATRRHAGPAGPGRTDVAGRDVDWHVVDDDVVAAICGTVHPQGLVARCRAVDRDLAAVLAARPRLVAVCADIADPGNAGSVLRCADAAGADAVVFAGHSVDPYNPKAVRSSVGSLFHVDVSVVDRSTDAVAAVRSAGLTVLAADGAADTDLPEAERRGLLGGATAWLFGNEARGLPAEIRALADHAVSVPIYGRAESLNLASAAAVCLYRSAAAHREQA